MPDIQFAKDPDPIEGSPGAISFVAYHDTAGRCLVYGSNMDFKGVNHVQSIIKFGVALVPVDTAIVPDAIVRHALDNAWRIATLLTD